MKLYFAEYFKRKIKHLKKKYPSIKEDLLKKMGTLDLKKETSVGKFIYKIRIPSSDMKRGKSGGFRAYLYLYLKKDLLIPLCIYPKSETESISQNELKYHFDQIIKEILENLQ